MSWQPDLVVQEAGVPGENHPPNDFSRRQEALSRSDGFSNSRQDGFSKNRSLEFPSNRSMQPKPPSKLNQRVISPHFHPPTNNPSDNFPSYSS
jgi:hypothetical protein